MRTLLDIAMRICAAAILGAVAEYILPEGRLKGSASRAVGLVILVMIAEPIALAVAS